MNILALVLTLLAVAEPTLMPKVIFWILLLLWFIGSLWTPGTPENPSPTWVRGSSIVQLILFGILGYYLMGF